MKDAAVACAITLLAGLACVTAGMWFLGGTAWGLLTLGACLIFFSASLSRGAANG